jgi:predicted RNase H-like HicB family nuclease
MPPTLTLTTEEAIEIRPERRPYDVEIVPDIAGGQPVFVARHPDLPGCMSHGATPAEALANLDDARQMYLDGLRSAGLPVPPEKAHPRYSLLEPLRAEPVEGPVGRQTRWRVTVDVTGDL